MISAIHTTVVDVGTKHSIETGNLEENKQREMPYLVEDIE